MARNPFLETSAELWPESIRDVVRLIAGRESPDDIEGGMERLRQRAGVAPSTWRKFLAGDGLSPPSRQTIVNVGAALMASPHLETRDGAPVLRAETVVHAAISSRKRWLFRQWERCQALSSESTSLADHIKRVRDASPFLRNLTKGGPGERECKHCWGAFDDGVVGPAARGVPPPGFGEGEEHWMCETWFRNGQLTDEGRAEIARRRESPPHPDDLPTRP